MYKILPLSLLLIINITCYQNVSAHGAGGGGGSYTFDKDDHIAERKAEKKATEEKQDQESWGDFMNVLKKQTTEDKSDEDLSNE